MSEVVCGDCGVNDFLLFPRPGFWDYVAAWAAIFCCTVVGVVFSNRCVFNFASSCVGRDCVDI